MQRRIKEEMVEQSHLGDRGQENSTLLVTEEVPNTAVIGLLNRCEKVMELLKDSKACGIFNVEK